MASPGMAFVRSIVVEGGAEGMAARAWWRGQGTSLSKGASGFSDMEILTCTCTFTSTRTWTRRDSVIEAAARAVRLKAKVGDLSLEINRIEVCPGRVPRSL